jgi:hypothetical protein
MPKYEIEFFGVHKSMAVEAARCEVSREMFFHIMSKMGKPCKVSEIFERGDDSITTYFTFDDVMFCMEMPLTD